MLKEFLKMAKWLYKISQNKSYLILRGYYAVEYVTSRKVTGSNPDEVIGLLNLPNPSSRTISLVSTQPLTEMSTRNLPWAKVQAACKADNFTAICEPIVQKMWEPRRLTTLWASTAC
jgi:hypothetical protein